MSKLVRSKAPLRLGFGGGGTDIKSYSDIFTGSVLNATIDRYSYSIIKPLNYNYVRLNASDLNILVEKETQGPFELDGILNIHKAVYNHIIKNFNNNQILPVELITFCTIPPGSGLGSSSAMVVSLIKSFVEYLNLPLDDYAIARLAIKIERVDCNLSGGLQDQYASAIGGFNFMQFYKNENTVVNKLRIKNWIICELEASLVLYFTGISRSSSKIIDDQTKNIISGSDESLNAMHNMKEQSIIMKDYLLKGDLKMFAETMKSSWEAKKYTSKNVTNSKVDEIYNAAIDAGATSGKLSGAGGGGFMLFYVNPEKRASLIKCLDQFEGKNYDFHFTNEGCQSWFCGL
tara:strand:- start:111 stop:1148 length:1038 start_codon:yes stop_codon:yes gene_type:complete